MQIFWNELKKILTWKILLLLVIVNSILFTLLIEFEIKYFPNGRPALDSYNIGIEMIEKYGINIDEEDFEDLRKIYEGEKLKADAYLQARPEFIDAGIDTYEKFINSNRENKVQSELNYKVFHEDMVDLFWELQARASLIEFYEGKEASLEAYRSDANEQQKARYDVIGERGLHQVYPGVVIDNFKRFIFNVAITIIISVALVVSPVFLKDRTRQLLGVQYTTKKGRSLYKTKALAGFVSTFLVITTLLFVYFGFYSLNNTSMYFKVPIHMFIAEYSWYDPTFFQYILLAVIAIYILGFVTALFAMSFSSIVPNYISLIGIQIPYMFLIISLGINYLVSGIISIYLPQWLVPTSYSVLLVVSILWIVRMWKRENKRDIVA